MTFPSLWLAISVVAAYFVFIMVLTQGVSALMRKGAREDDWAGGAERAQGAVGMGGEIASYWLPPLLFFAFTGSFPWTFAAVAVVLWLIATTISEMLIVRGLGARRDARDGDSVLLLNIFGMTQNMIWSGCVIALVGLGCYIYFFIAGLQTAERVDLTSAPGLFEVALFVFFWPAVLTFITTWPMNSVRLLSSGTPRQTRVEVFVRSVRLFMIGVWGLFYPFFAFRQDVLQENATWLYLAAAAALAFYLLTAVAPFEVGRLGFARREREALEGLRDEGQALTVATEPNVSPAFRDAVLADAEARLRQRFEELCVAHPMLVSVARAELPAKETTEEGGAPAPDAPPPSRYEALLDDLDARTKTLPQLAKIGGAYRERLPNLDYRLFTLARAGQVLRHIGDAGWVRGLAILIERDVARRLERREAKSILVASIGVLLSAIVPLAQREFDPELRAAVSAAADYARDLVGAAPADP